MTVHPPRTSDAEAGVWPFGAKVAGEHDASVVFPITIAQLGSEDHVRRDVAVGECGIQAAGIAVLAGALWAGMLARRRKSP